MVALDPGLPGSGTCFHGDFEERLRAVLKEVEDAPGEIIRDALVGRSWPSGRFY